MGTDFVNEILRLAAILPGVPRDRAKKPEAVRKALKR